MSSATVAKVRIVCEIVMAVVLVVVVLCLIAAGAMRTGLAWLVYLLGAFAIGPVICLVVELVRRRKRMT